MIGVLLLGVDAHAQPTALPLEFTTTIVDVDVNSCAAGGGGPEFALPFSCGDATGTVSLSNADGKMTISVSGSALGAQGVSTSARFDVRVTVPQSSQAVALVGANDHDPATDFKQINFHIASAPIGGAVWWVPPPPCYQGQTV